MYYIGTKTKFLAIRPDGHMYMTEDFDDTKLFSSRQKAAQTLVSLPRRFFEASTQWSIHEYVIDDEWDKKTTDCKNENTLNNMDEVNNECTKTDYITLLNTLGNLKDQKAGCLTHLNSKLSEVNQEIRDIEHYIEFNKLNACGGYAAYKMLYDALQRRREIKDNIIAAKAIYDSCDINAIISRIGQLNNRTYTPRQLPELFN